MRSVPGITVAEVVPFPNMGILGPVVANLYILPVGHGRALPLGPVTFSAFWRCFFSAFWRGDYAGSGSSFAGSAART